MPKQTLVFESPVQLSVQNSMLKIAYKDNPDNVTLRAIEDIAIILIDNHSASLTTPLIGKLAEQNVAVVFCNERHMPSSMLMNLDANTLQEKYFRLQLDAPLPLKKQMWKNVVEAKIKNQALHLKSLGKKHVRSYHQVPPQFHQTRRTERD
ncbi:MAG: CRISPR-associated endonuclease Cas1 [Fibrobacter sp.]|nr:CRISPR-associated endonuclease Cas1 [Fibrobacter sp.]